MLQTVVVGTVNLLFTIIAIWTVDLLGRKPLMLVGAAGMFLSLAGLGTAAMLNPHRRLGVGLHPRLHRVLCAGGWAGHLGDPLGDLPNRVRGRSWGSPRFCLWTANFIVSQTFPMLDENDYLVERFNHGFPFFVYAAFCIVLVLVVLFGVPETKGRSLEEIERHWLRGRDSS